MAITSQTFTTSELVTAAKMNANVRDNWQATWPTATEAWQAWSPSYANLTVGNGTVVARYIQVGDLVTAAWLFTMGSTSSVGTGPTVSLPVTATSSYTATYMTLGTAEYVNAWVAAYLGLADNASTTTVALQSIGASGIWAAVSATVPFTFATSDALSFQISYEAA